MDNQEKKIKLKNIEKKNIEKKDNQLTSKEKNIAELEKKISINQKEIYNLKLRHLANIENIKKNVEKKIQNIKNEEKENFFKQIIPIINVIEDILVMSKKFNLDNEPSIQGIELTLQSLLNILVKFGVKIEGNKNEIFNPNLHDVIQIKPSHKIKSNYIISVEKKGFSFNNTILRKATVIISKS
jgi:molecular chaperone GrpE